MTHHHHHSKDGTPALTQVYSKMSQGLEKPVKRVRSWPTTSSLEHRFSDNFYLRPSEVLAVGKEGPGSRCRLACKARLGSCDEEPGVAQEIL